MSRLRADEMRVVELLGEAANAFGELPAEHSSDGDDFSAALRAAYNVVYSRVGVRAGRKGSPRSPIGFR